MPYFSNLEILLRAKKTKTKKETGKFLKIFNGPLYYSQELADHKIFLYNGTFKET